MAIDQEQLVVLLLRERIKLLAYIRALVRDEHLAEDVFQESSALAIRKREEIHDAAYCLGWLRRTARNVALKALRQRRQCMFLDEATLQHLEEHWAEQDLTPTSDLMDALRACLREMSPYARHLIRLRYAEGISGMKLAEAVGRKLNAVYVALTRIHRSLADCIRRRLAEGEIAHG